MYAINPLYLAFLALFAQLALARPVGTPPFGHGLRPLTPPLQPQTPQGRTIAFGILVYTLGAETGSLQTSTWTLIGSNQIAKQFKTHDSNKELAAQQLRAFNYQSRHIRRLRGEDAVHGGTSQIGGAGDYFSWIITDRPQNNQLFQHQPGYLAETNTRRVCKSFLHRIVRPMFKLKMEEFYNRHRLVNIMANQANTMWDPQAKLILGFSDFGALDDVNGPVYKQAVERFWPGENRQATLEELIEKLGLWYYNDDDLCPESKSSKKIDPKGPTGVRKPPTGERGGRG